MNPRTHPRGAPPDFTLPRPNPNPQRMTDALWWLVCMRELLEQQRSENGGTYANKPGSHNVGANLPDFGEGDPRTDHSIRHAWNRTGPWWQSKCAAHDWTFLDAQRGDYRTINLYTRRMIAAMQDPDDLRPDEVIFYTLGNVDGDVTTEGYNELKNGPESSGDTTHAWHRHDSFFRRIIGDFGAMWKILTIDMGWTYTEWQQSTQEDIVELTPAQLNQIAKANWDYALRNGHTAETNILTLFNRTGYLANQFAGAISKAVAAIVPQDIDEAALAAELAARLPADRDDITSAELQEAIVGAFGQLVNQARPV